MKRTLRVTGNGKISVKPDTICLLINLEGGTKNYDETMRMATKQSEMVVDCFEKIGFHHSDVKTISFNIDTNYERYLTKDENWKRKFIGYQYEYEMKVEFPVDNVILGKILHNLAHCNSHPEIRIVYTVKNVEMAKTLLLKNAVKNSLEKAKILSEAAGVKLGEIVSIDYSWDKKDIVSTSGGQFMKKSIFFEDDIDDYSIDIDPEDIDVMDTVCVVWEII